MKKTLIYVFATLSLFLLSSCSNSVSQEEYDALLSENASLKAEIETLSSENQSLAQENEDLLNASSASNDSSSSFEELNDEAEAMAETLKKITSGALYDTVNNIIDNASLSFTSDGSLYITFAFDQGSPEENASQFFDIAEQICHAYAIEDEYSSVSFTAKTNGGLLVSLDLIDYESLASFQSFFTVLLSEREEDTAIFESEYKNSPLCKDVSDSFDASLDALKSKYGLED